jgi:hypothetical protein
VSRQKPEDAEFEGRFSFAGFPHEIGSLRGRQFNRCLEDFPFQSKIFHPNRPFAASRLGGGFLEGHR